jgi:hypothetical protein
VILSENLQKFEFLTPWESKMVKKLELEDGGEPCSLKITEDKK